MILGGPPADLKLLRDLTVLHPLRDQPEHIELAW